uniref:Uncharacterized protein n=1 Tax=Acrobeloides nanus TaxID=290746 RepID=A0A914CZ90_9BILA
MNTSLVDGSDTLERLLSLRQQLDSSKLSDDDQQFLWKMRYKIQSNFPQMLPVLADCPYIWKERETICEFYSLLANWPELNVDSAMELLDGRYPDCVVRATAVNKLDEKLGDDQMQLYLLPLIQAIKYESFSASPLALLLVKRALLNYHIGHTLFWLLRAELAQFTYEVNTQRMPQMYVRYALMLEAYCRGNSVHLESMLKQVEMVNTLTALSAMVKSMSAKDSATKKLQQELKLLKESLQHMQSPMNSTDRLGELIIDECRVLSSAKMPLKLTWNNPEPLSRLTIPTHQIMFKNGDDLRQDMLTLQVMRIMDTKWKNHNLDYCMTLYEVLPMGRSIGMIHVVQNCQTIFQIQMAAKQVSSALNMDNTLLNRYIYQKCSNDSKQYMECVDRFAYSLAGYSIATYVLGIKDRHQDNIMLTKDGRIFHIDFGHILGHTKRKLGINRERTDFILTDHFLYVVSRGKPNFRETHEYNSFREACIKGFMVIYHHARFFIALFQMMLCMGLPELSKPEDVHFLHTSLIYEKTKREDAKSAFTKIFDDVAKSDWSTNINWFFHSVKHL